MYQVGQPSRLLVIHFDGPMSFSCDRWDRSGTNYVVQIAFISYGFYYMAYIYATPAYTHSCNDFLVVATEPPERLEVRETSQLRPISDQQIVSAGHHSDPSLNDITYLGPYVEGQNVTVVCTAYGGKTS